MAFVVDTTRWRVRALVGLLVAALAIVSLLGLARAAFAGPNDGLPRATVALDRGTPRRALEGFLAATRAGDFERAAHFLDLRGVARVNHGKEGPILAQRLAYVLERKLTFDLSRVSDAADGESPQGIALVGTVFVDEEPVPVSFVRVRFDDGVQRWILSKTTVSMVPTLWASFGPHGWEDRIPQSLKRLRIQGVEAWQWLGLFVLLLAAWLAGKVVGRFVVGVLRRIARRTRTSWDDELTEAARGPTTLVVAVACIRFFVEPLHLATSVERIAQRISFTLLVIGLGWFVMRATDVFAEWAVSRLPEGGSDARGRGVRTQLAVMQRFATIATVVISVSVVLIQFDFVRSVGLSLLASAGVVGIVFGIAAQKSLGAIIGGLQLSITQPIRIGDVVVLEGEYGKVDEITLTYVVLKLWDERRMVVPISRFLDQPFQNWTKASPELHGTVMVQADWTVPVDAVRAELGRICEASPSWDKRAASIKLIEAGDRTVTLRALVSAADADALWNLRCEVREKLVAFLARLDAGAHLPKVRSDTAVKPG